MTTMTTKYVSGYFTMFITVMCKETISEFQ